MNIMPRIEKKLRENTMTKAIVTAITRVAARRFAARSSRFEGPFSKQDGFFSSIALVVVMIACEPCLLLVGLSICLQMLRRGQIPIVAAVWSHARVAKHEVEKWGASSSLDHASECELPIHSRSGRSSA